MKTVVIEAWNFTNLCIYVPSPTLQIFSACQTLAMNFGGEGVPFGMVSVLLVDSLIASFTADSVSFYEEDLIDTLTISTLVLKNMNAVVTDTMLFVVDTVSGDHGLFCIPNRRDAYST
jgi:hypothetical protein